MKEWLIKNGGKTPVELEMMFAHKNKDGEESWMVNSPMRINGRPLTVAECLEVVETYNAVRWEGRKISDNDAAERVLAMRRERDMVSRILEQCEYTLGLHNPCETVIGRIKYSLMHITWPVFRAMYRGEPWPDGAWTYKNERERVECATKAIWGEDGNYTYGFENETDEFLDAIGLPKDERGSLIRTRKDGRGLKCVECDRDGDAESKNRLTDTYWMVYPNGIVRCHDCDQRIRDFGEKSKVCDKTEVKGEAK